MGAGRACGEAGLGRGILERAVTQAAEDAVGLPVRIVLELLDLVVHVRVGGEDVLPPVVVEVEEAVPPPAARRHQPAEPAGMRDVLEEALPHVPVQREALPRERGDMDVGPPVVVVVAEVDAHGRHLLPVLGERDAGQQGRLLEGAVLAVVQQEARELVVGDVHVQEAVAVVVGEGEPHAPALDLPQARFHGHVLERAVPAVVVQGQGHGREPLRMAVHANAARRVPAEAVHLGRPHRVVDDQEVEPAVVVVVEPAAADGPLVGGNAGLRGDVFETSADVAIQHLAMHAGHEEVGGAVVVVVRGGHAHGVAGAAQARGFGHVAETHGALVPEEPVGILRVVLLQAGNGRPVREEDVEPPVAVVIEEGDPAGHGLDQVLARRGAVLVDEVEPGLARCLRGVGLFWWTKSSPASRATSRSRRRGGSAGVAGPETAASTTPTTKKWGPRRVAGYRVRAR